MSNRRQFLGTLGKTLGFGGLLLPLAGKGALALPADLGQAAQLPVTAAELPFSKEAVQLRGIRRELRACFLSQDTYPEGAYSRAWRSLMRDSYHPLATRVVARPASSWADCVELAEICWQRRSRSLYLGDPPTPCDALIEAVLSLGGGERYHIEGEGARHE
jgi:hypothetical protein